MNLTPGKCPRRQNKFCQSKAIFKKKISRLLVRMTEVINENNKQKWT